MKKPGEAAPVRPTTLWGHLKARFDLLLLLAVLGVFVYRFGPQVGAALGLGGESTEVRSGLIQTLTGDPLSLEQLRGKVVLVNLWATWCPPCVLEMPGFQRVYEDYRDQGFVVLGLSRDQGSPDLVRAFLRQKRITYPVAMEAGSGIEGFGMVTTLPASFLIGRDGTVRHRVTGIYAEPTLRMAVQRLLEEAVGGAP
jgi:peroxiredoxin